MQKPPDTVEELLQTAKAIAGLSLGKIAKKCDFNTPDNLLREKGWVGQLLEASLGANAGCKAEPDFLNLGIELKTIPIDTKHQPKETTFVSTIPLMSLSHLTWETSTVRKKLAKVLWVPIQADKSIPIADRRIGNPILWQLNPETEAILKQDWEELTDMICLGQIDQISARLGQYLQIRPKGANSKALVKAIGPDGAPIMTLPRGFYLRTRFTQQILENY